MHNKHIGNTTEARSKGILNNDTEPNLSYATMNFQCNEQYFDDIMNSIKVEKVSSFHDDSTDSEDSSSIAYKSIDSKNKKQQQDEMYKLVSYEKDVNVTESNVQELTDTILVDSKIVSLHTRSPSTVLPIMKILSPNSEPHTCLECCFKCNMVFRVLDNPLHLCQIRSIDKRNEFLKIEPSLCVDSCLCDFCWRQLEKIYKSNKSKNRKEGHSEKKSKLLEHLVKKNVSKNQNQTGRCLFHLCSEPNFHKLSVNECENIKKLFSTIESCHLVFVQSTNQTADFLKFPFCLCKVHNNMIMVMIKCQICGDTLNAPFNTDDWSMHKMWNFVLIKNNLPLILKPGMFICVTCKGHISKTNPGFPTIDLPRLQEYILINNAIRSKLYGESQYNLFNICRGPTYVAPPIAVSKIEKECDNSTKVIFSDHLTTNHNSQVDFFKNDKKSITRTEQNLLTSKLESKDKGLYFVQHEEKYLKTFTSNKPKDQLYNLYTDPKPHTSGIDTMANSLNKSFDDTSENILSEQNPSENLTDNNLSNNCCIYFSYAAKNHVIRHDNNKDLFRLHVNHQLKNYDCKLSKNERINQYLGIANDNSLQNVCKVNNVEIDEYESEIISSCQALSEHNGIENNQKKLFSHAICSVTQDRCSMNLKEAIELPNAIVNRISIKRKQSNGLCDIISNKDVKKQRLNEKFSSYENNSTDDNATTSYKNENVTHPFINLSSISNMTFNCENRYDPNSDISASDSFSDSEIFSEIDSENLSSDFEVNETDYIIIASEDDLSLDSDCKSVKSVLEIKPDHEIEIDCVSLSDNEKSLDCKGILNGENILENDTTLLDSVKNSNCENMSDAETVLVSDYKDYIIVHSDDALSLDSDCKLVKSELEIKLDHEIEIDCVSLSDNEKSLDCKGILNGENILENDTTLLDSVKNSNCENMSDAETVLVSDYTDYIIVHSDDALSLDSDCKLVKSELEIKLNHEIEIDCVSLPDNEKSLDCKGILNGENILENDTNLLDSVKNSNCENMSDAETVLVSDYKDYIIVHSDDALSLDSDCKLVKSELEIKLDHEIEIDCVSLSDSEKSLDCKGILNGENILDNDKTLLDSVKNSNCEIIPNSETESHSDKQSYINISVTDEKFNNNKLSPFKIVSKVQKGPDHEILLDGDKVFETASWSEKGTIKYTIISDDEIKPSSNKGSTCIIISDNDEEFNNKVFTTHKINVQKGSDSKILLDGEKVEIVCESENIKSTYKIESSGKKKSKCIIIFDNEKEFMNKKLSTFKIVSNVKKGSNFEILLDDEKVYEIECESENRKIKYMIVSEDEMKSSGNKGSLCTFISDNEEKCNNKKSTFKILVKNVQKV